MRRTAWILCLAVVLLAAVLAVSAEGDARRHGAGRHGGKRHAEPCTKRGLHHHLKSINHRYPVAVVDYHPIDNAINPNAIPDIVADRTARVIIRKHLEWERENPAPPKQLSTRELKDMGLKMAEETLAIKKEGKQFKALAKFVDDDAKAYVADQAAKAKLAADLNKKRALDAAAKVKSAALLRQVADQRALLAAKKVHADAAKKAAKAKATLKAAGVPAKKLAALPAHKLAVPVAFAPKKGASAKIHGLKSKVAGPKPIPQLHQKPLQAQPLQAQQQAPAQQRK